VNKKSILSLSSKKINGKIQEDTHFFLVALK